MLERSRIEGREAAGPEPVRQTSLQSSSKPHRPAAVSPLYGARPLSLPETARISRVFQALLNGSGLDRLVGPDGLAGRHRRPWPSPSSDQREACISPIPIIVRTATLQREEQARPLDGRQPHGHVPVLLHELGGRPHGSGGRRSARSGRCRRERARDSPAPRPSSSPRRRGPRSKREAPSKTGMVRSQLAGSVRLLASSAGIRSALMGSTTPRLSAALTGTRSGFGSTGGLISTLATLPAVRPMRTLRWSLGGLRQYRESGRLRLRAGDGARRQSPRPFRR